MGQLELTDESEYNKICFRNPVVDQDFLQDVVMW